MLVCVVPITSSTQGLLIGTRETSSRIELEGFIYHVGPSKLGGGGGVDVSWC